MKQQAREVKFSQEPWIKSNQDDPRPLVGATRNDLSIHDAPLPPIFQEPTLDVAHVVTESICNLPPIKNEERADKQLVSNTKEIKKVKSAGEQTNTENDCGQNSSNLHFQTDIDSKVSLNEGISQTTQFATPNGYHSNAIHRVPEIEHHSQVMKLLEAQKLNHKLPIMRFKTNRAEKITCKTNPYHDTDLNNLAYRYGRFAYSSINR
jgi:hypothetical protein